MKKLLFLIALTASFLPLALNATYAGSGDKKKSEASKENNEKQEITIEKDNVNYETKYKLTLTNNTGELIELEVKYPSKSFREGKSNVGRQQRHAIIGGKDYWDTYSMNERTPITFIVHSLNAEGDIVQTSEPYTTSADRMDIKLDIKYDDAGKLIIAESEAIV